MTADTPGKTLRFVLLLLAAALAVTATTAASPQVATDRTIKLDLLAKLKHSPQILVLGDSRGRHADPSFLQRLTGHSGFNAAVTGGSAPEAYVFVRYAADLFPHQKRRYIFFVSSGLAGNIVDARTEADPRIRRYLQEVAPYLDAQTFSSPLSADAFSNYRPDGSLPGRASSPSRRQVQKVKEQAAALVEAIRHNPPASKPQPDPKRKLLFEHMLAYMNSRGERPVIVFNPLYPTVYAALKAYGLPLLTSSLDYLHRLRARYSFVVVNCENIKSWGGTTYDWDNATHVNELNMRRMLRYIVAHSDGALR